MKMITNIDKLTKLWYNETLIRRYYARSENNKIINWRRCNR